MLNENNGVLLTELNVEEIEQVEAPGILLTE
jgi:hypothetical protein